MDKPPYVYEVLIQTTAPKLWEALTRGEFTRQYWAGQYFETDWKVGSELNHRMADGGIVIQGKILVCDPPKTLSYSFDPAQAGTGRPPTQVTFRLMERKNSVLLTVIHEGFEPGSPDFRGAAQAWVAILSGLKTLLETGKPLLLDWAEVHSDK